MEPKPRSDGLTPEDIQDRAVARITRIRRARSFPRPSADDPPGFDLPRLQHLIKRQFDLLDQQIDLPPEEKAWTWKLPLDEEQDQMQDIANHLFEWTDAVWHHAVERNSSHAFWHRYLKFCWLTLGKLFSARTALPFSRMNWEHGGVVNSQGKVVFQLPKRDRGVSAPNLVLFLWKEILLRLFVQRTSVELAEEIADEIRELFRSPFVVRGTKMKYAMKMVQDQPLHGDVPYSDHDRKRAMCALKQYLNHADEPVYERKVPETVESILLSLRNHLHKRDADAVTKILVRHPGKITILNEYIAALVFLIRKGTSKQCAIAKRLLELTMRKARDELFAQVYEVLPGLKEGGLNFDKYFGHLNHEDVKNPDVRKALEAWSDRYLDTKSQTEISFYKPLGLATNIFPEEDVEMKDQSHIPDNLKCPDFKDVAEKCPSRVGSRGVIHSTPSVRRSRKKISADRVPREPKLLPLNAVQFYDFINQQIRRTSAPEPLEVWNCFVRENKEDYPWLMSQGTLTEIEDKLMFASGHKDDDIARYLREGRFNAPLIRGLQRICNLPNLGVPSRDGVSGRTSKTRSATPTAIGKRSVTKSVSPVGRKRLKTRSVMPSDSQKRGPTRSTTLEILERNSTKPKQR